MTDHETIDQWWRVLDEEFQDTIFDRVKKRPYQRQLRVEANGGQFVSRLLVDNYQHPLAISVSKAEPNSPKHQVTKLDFINSQPDLYDYGIRIGHLLLPKVAHQPVHGLHVVKVAEIPEQALFEFDKGVGLLRTAK